MGMDVYGRNPNAKAGEYFRASIWSWRPIYGLIVELCSDLIDEDTLRAMAFNEGAGPTEAKTCVQMAQRIADWLRANQGGHQVYVEREGSFEGAVTDALKAAGWSTQRKFESSFTADREHLIEWSKFLLHCGGFEVW